MNKIETVQSGANSSIAAAGIGILVLLAIFVIFALAIVAMWRLYEKAGKPGWASIVPFYNIFVMLEIVGRPTWWFAVILLVPIVQTVFSVIVAIDFAKSYGKGLWYGLGSLFFPFIIYPVMAWDKNVRYIGPAAASNSSPNISSAS